MNVMSTEVVNVSSADCNLVPGVLYIICKASKRRFKCDAFTSFTGTIEEYGLTKPLGSLLLMDWTEVLSNLRLCF